MVGGVGIVAVDRVGDGSTVEEHFDNMAEERSGSVEGHFDTAGSGRTQVVHPQEV